ncbi:MAG: serine/threonine protein kinase [Rickettsiales bacterium]|mgnify:FL=1|nr:serine/threonine protein kinase [Rickettsiales bacterium]|tara:strand:+ start:196 stop:621 length:426 start_codon:yes stop_codon:yes gene_type:complete
MTAKRFHSTSVVIEDLGILIRGQSGCGKSDLALRLIDSGATLISDDLTICKKIGDYLYLHPHSKTKGLLEVREIGIMTVPYVENVKLTLVVELVEEKFERIPEMMNCSILGMKFPKIKIFGKSSSAVAKIKIKLNQIRSYA